MEASSKFLQIPYDIVHGQSTVAHEISRSTHDSLPVTKVENLWTMWLRSFSISTMPLVGPTTWEGYYWYNSNSSELSARRLDPPMQDIQLSFDSEPEKSSFALRGAGHDSVGHFSLRGALFNSNGCVYARKSYTNGTQWAWCGSVTPFGIVGSKYQMIEIFPLAG